MSAVSNLDFIKGIYNNKKLKKIVNVYQKKYINAKAPGFGDFLRGSIYLTHICNIIDLEFDIDINNHPVSKFLNTTDSSFNICYLNVEGFICHFKSIEHEKKNIRLFIDRLNNYNEEVIYLFCNYNPLFEIENPNFNIIQKARCIVIPKIEPTKYVLDILDNKLQEYNLERNKYAVIHIRSGDYYMNIKKNIDTEKHKISLKHLKDIIHILKNQLNPKKMYIIIGDNNEIKKYIVSIFPKIIMFNSKITHLGEDINNDDSAILDTLIDFNIMRFSNFLISFSAYGHGSGFSKQCASIYNIPFLQIKLQPTLKYKI